MISYRQKPIPLSIDGAIWDWRKRNESTANMMAMLRPALQFWYDYPGFGSRFTPAQSAFERRLLAAGYHISNAGNRIRPNKANLINLRIWRCQSTGATGNPTNFHGNPRNLSYLWLRFKQPKNPGFFWGGYIPLPRLIVLKRVQNPMIGLQIFLALIFLAWQRPKQRCVSICHGLAPLVPNSSRSPLYGVPV